ncbi:MAG: hypothetical protein OXC72_06160 [Roseovarius sp.]|nr:hypothetical protein [Roseovarius sp.]
MPRTTDKLPVRAKLAALGESLALNSGSSFGKKSGQSGPQPNETRIVSTHMRMQLEET